MKHTMLKNIKLQIIYSIFFSIIFYFIFMPLVCYCSETQTVTITKEDIINAKANEYPVILNKKQLRDVEIMEKRHFSKAYQELDDSRRLKNLERELFGRIWVYSPTQDRINKLKLASSNTVLIGTAMPARLSSKRTLKKLRSSDLGLRTKDNVGLIDGFLKLISPEKYEVYKKYSEHRFEDYEW